MGYKEFIEMEVKRVDTAMKQLNEELVLTKDAPLRSVASVTVSKSSSSSSLGREVQVPILVASEKEILLLKDNDSGDWESRVLYQFSEEKCTGLRLSEFDQVMYALASFERHFIVRNVNNPEESKLVRFLSRDDFNHKMRINSLNVFYNGKNNLSSKIVAGCSGKGAAVVSLDELIDTNLLSLTDNHMFYSADSSLNLPLRTVASQEYIYVSEGNTISVFDGNTLKLSHKYEFADQITALAVNSEGKLWSGTINGNLYVDGVIYGRSLGSDFCIKKIRFITTQREDTLLLMAHDQGFVYQKNGADYDIISPLGWRGKHIDFTARKQLYTIDSHFVYRGYDGHETKIFRCENKLSYIETLGGI